MAKSWNVPNEEVWVAFVDGGGNLDREHKPEVAKSG